MFRANLIPPPPQRIVRLSPAHAVEHPVPVTARLSKRFYEVLGEDVANELVDWFNAVDLTYRADLRELNELNFARFDAKLEQRVAALDAKLEQRMAALEARIDQGLAELEARLDARIQLVAAQLETRLERRLGEQGLWLLGAWVVLMGSIIGLWLRG